MWLKMFVAMMERYDKARNNTLIVVNYSHMQVRRRMDAVSTHEIVDDTDKLMLAMEKIVAQRIKVQRQRLTDLPKEAQQEEPCSPQ
jgi:hypothetical protein